VDTGTVALGFQNTGGTDRIALSAVKIPILDELSKAIESKEARIEPLYNKYDQEIWVNGKPKLRTVVEFQEAGLTPFISDDGLKMKSPFNCKFTKALGSNIT
jgi:hypothetical protein